MRGGCDYSYISLPLYGATVACFASMDPYTGNSSGPNCEQVQAWPRLASLLLCIRAAVPACLPACRCLHLAVATRTASCDVVPRHDGLPRPDSACACKPCTRANNMPQTTTTLASLLWRIPQLSSVRQQLHAMGADTRRMGTFCESHDNSRFLTRRCACREGWGERCAGGAPQNSRAAHGSAKARTCFG